METDPARRHESLFEIGAEEIPASYLPPALEFMKARAESLMAAKRLSFKFVQALGTPRRLTLLITGVASKSESSVADMRATGAPTGPVGSDGAESCPASARRPLPKVRPNQPRSCSM